MTLTAGLAGEAQRTVTSDLTARALGSGDVDVFGTPAMLALMEEAAVAAVAPALEPTDTSVGVSVSLEHLAPSRVGSTVRGVARVTDVDGRRITFEIEAYEGDTLIGRGTHIRAVVDRSRFA